MKKEDVINYFGTQVKAAEALGVTQASVSRWGVEVPPLRAFEIECITNGELKVEFSSACSSESKSNQANLTNVSQ